MNTKESIIKLRDNDDRDSFAFLYHLYWAKVYNFARLYITSLADVEEVVQEVFIKIWENRYALNEEQNFEGYLFIVMRNLIFNRSRRHLNETFYQLSVVEAVDEAYSIEEQIDATNLGVHIESLISMLSPRQQEVFRLSRDEQLSYREIAEMLQISEKTVEHHISDALKFLRKNIRLYLLFFYL